MITLIGGFGVQPPDGYLDRLTVKAKEVYT
jgi:hypothetical protein